MSDTMLDHMRYVVGETGPVNCIKPTIQPIQIKHGVFMNTDPHNIGPHTRQVDIGTRNNNVLLTGTKLSGRLIIEDEEAILTVEMPGVNPSELEVIRLDDTLRIRINPRDRSTEFDTYTMNHSIRQLYVNLHEDDVVSDVKLALGVLTVMIDLGRDVQSYNVA